ncbi:energy coupling factor transporter S component ThiW [archaeon]|nr:MAG: energy coupling factor transporter S component ThiW [archaeon]
METKLLVQLSLYTAVGVFLASFLWFPAGPTKCFPGQHIVNAVTGVLLGPIYASIVALLIGIIRNLVGWGTIFAFPGGIPGAIVVGVFSLLFKHRRRHLAALSEPLGTVLIGGTLSTLIIGMNLSTLLFIWSSFAISSVPGSIIGFIILTSIRRYNLASGDSRQ